MTLWILDPALTIHDFVVGILVWLAISFVVVLWHYLSLGRPRYNIRPPYPKPVEKPDTGKPWTTEGNVSYLDTSSLRGDYLETLPRSRDYVSPYLRNNVRDIKDVLRSKE